MSTHKGESGGMIDFGPKRLDFVPYLSINELPQVRTEYNETAIDDLAMAIQSGEDGSVISSDSFELGNAILNGRHSQRSAKKYIDDHGEYHRIAARDRVDVQDLTPLDDDSAIILIAGHRRRRAVGRLLQMNNIQPINARVASSIRDEIEFGQAIGLQLRENVYERPSPQDEARAIDLSYRYTSERMGHAPNIKKLASQLGFSETKVRDAIAFASLPDVIQEYTRSGVFSYTVTRQLKPLFDEYFSMYKDDAHADPFRAAEDAVVEFCDIQIKRRLEGKSDETIMKAIADQTQNIHDTAKYRQGTFDFELDAGSPSRRRQIATRQLTQTALGVMRYRLATGDIKESELASLEDLIAAHRSAQVRHEVVELPLGLVAEAS